jgi:2-dehydropantoate 2-reductase
VLGAGAVGGYLAARLATAGRDVAVVTRGAHLAAIRERGLTLVTPVERFTVPVTASDDPAAIGPVDLVLVTAKTPTFAALAEAMGPLLHETTAVLFAVNGVFWFYGHGFAPGGRAPDTARLDPGGVLHRRIGAARALGAVVYSPNEVVEPGTVENGRVDDNRLVLGEAAPGPVTPRLAAVRDTLSGCGFLVEATADLRRAMWAKLARNVASGPLACLTGADGRSLLADPDVRPIAIGLMREALAVAAAHGFDGLGIDPAKVAVGPPAAHKPSILQDLERGRPMEIDTMLAAVQDLARQAGVATPALDTLLPLVILRARLAGSYPG